MKRKIIIFLFCIATSIQMHTEEIEELCFDPNASITPHADEQSEDAIHTNDIQAETQAPLQAEHDRIIPFFTQYDETDTKNPSGRYWPAKSVIMQTINKIPLNCTSAYIGDASYSDIVEEQNLLPDQQLRYLGYFINPTSQQTIYLYGTKDKKTPNDANQETISYNVDTDDDDDDEEEDT